MKKIMMMAAFLGLMAGAAHAQGIPTLSGGIGADEQAKIAEAEKGYTLKVVFSATDGAYLTDVGYTVTDASGTVVTDGVSTGPYLLLGLPAGKYDIDAAFNNNHQAQKVTIAEGKLKTIQFRFAD